MQLINSAVYWATLILIMLIVIIAILGAIAFYFLKIKRIKSKEEIIDYNSFNRKDSKEYVKFDDIICGSLFDDSKSDDGIVVTNNGNTFTAAIEVEGFNFYSSSAEEQKACMVGMLGFLNTIENPIKYRQSTKAIDISYTILRYETKINALAKEIANLDLNYKSIVTKAEDYLEDPDKYDVLDKEMTSIRRTICTKDWMKKELENQIAWLKRISDGSMDSERISTYIYSWTYNPLDYTHELSQNEIYLKAITELGIKENIYASALSRCNCKCNRLSANELIDLFRRHTHPATADSVKYEDILNSSYNCLYVSCDSLIEIEKERLGDEAYARMLEDIMEQNQEEVERMNMKLDYFEAQTENELKDFLENFDPEKSLFSEDSYLANSL